MLKFAIEMEREIIRQMKQLEKNSGTEYAQLFKEILKIEGEFLKLLEQAAQVNVDLANYPPVSKDEIFGATNSLLPVITQEDQALSQNVCILWMIYSLIEKSAQYYRQASLHSPHPALKIFLSSLFEAKNIFRGRTSACVRMAYNDIWGRIGFAPFVLGKD